MFSIDKIKFVVNITSYAFSLVKLNFTDILFSRKTIDYYSETKQSNSCSSLGIFNNLLELFPIRRHDKLM